VELLRNAGVGSINFDLMYGLPGQSTDDLVDTLQRAIAMQPDRLAVFGYAHVPEFKADQRRIDETALPGPAERHEQAEAIAQALTLRGYRQIGLDHFALPGDSLAVAAEAGALHRNFQGYTTDPCQTLIGLGVSAIGRFPNGLVQNATRIPDYERRIAVGQLATVRGHELSPDDRRRASVIEQLMCDYRANVSGLDASLETFESEGLIRRSGEVIEVVDEARPDVRVVAAAFDAKLPHSAARHVTAV